MLKLKMDVANIEINPTEPDVEATGLLQRCRLLTVSAGTTNQTWSIDDYLIPQANVIFTGKVRGCGHSTRTEEAEVYGMVCAAKIPKEMDSDRKTEGDDVGSTSRKESLTFSLGKTSTRGWSVGSHNYTAKVSSLGRRILPEVFRSQACEAYQLSRSSLLDETIDIDGGTKNLKECRLLSTLHHPNIVQFFGVCWVPKSTFTADTTPVILEELMLLTLTEVLTSFQQKLAHDIPMAMKLSLLCDVARGLAYLHNHTPSIFHPNLKPEDIMVSSAMVAKITDLSDAQYGLKRYNDAIAFGYIGAFTMNVSPPFADVDGDLIEILVPCFSEDEQSRPPIPKVLEKLEQLAKRVPFQFSQMGAMMHMISEWRREVTSCEQEIKASANETSEQTEATSSPDPVPQKESTPPIQATSWQELVKEKEQLLVELRGKNSELLGTNEELEKKLVDQEERLKHLTITNMNGDIELADLLTELHDVVGWFLLGIHLGIPLPDLQKIRHQFGDSVDECKTEMLITYSKLKEPEWSDIVEALKRSGEQALALRIAQKYGIELASENDSPVDSMHLVPSNDVRYVSKDGVQQLIGSTELQDQVQQLVSSILVKDSELQKADKQLQEEQSKKNELEQEIILLRENLSILDKGTSFEPGRQKLMQQLFLKERERHYLSLVGIGQQHKEKNTHGNELDLILVEKDREIIRMRNELTEFEKRFSCEKNRAEELKAELLSVTSELAVKNAHIEEVEKSKEELNKYLVDERQRVDMLLMKVQMALASSIVNSTEFESPHAAPAPSPKCCVIL